MECEATWKATFDKLEQGTDEVIKFTNKVIEEVNRLSTMARVLNPQYAGALLMTKYMAQGVEKLMEFFKPRFAEPGNPCLLYRHSLAWTAQVGEPMQLLAGPIDPNRFDGETKWKGDGASAYRTLLLPQKNACVAIKTTADGVGGELVGIMTSICVYWAAVLTAVVGWAIACFKALKLCAGGPKGCALAVLGIIGATAAAAALIAGAELTFRTFLAEKHVAIQKNSTAEALNGTDHSWPTRPGIDVSDGSIEVTDGKVVDDTDWHMK